MGIIKNFLSSFAVTSSQCVSDVQNVSIFSGKYAHGLPMLLCTQRQFYPTKMQKNISNRKFHWEKITVSISTITNRIALPLMEIFFHHNYFNYSGSFIWLLQVGVYGLKIVLFYPKHPKSILSGLICQKNTIDKKFQLLTKTMD